MRRVHVTLDLWTDADKNEEDVKQELHEYFEDIMEECSIHFRDIGITSIQFG